MGKSFAGQPMTSGVMTLTLELVESAYWLPVNEIWLEPQFNCRESISVISVEELARSIEAKGLQFPIIVQPREDGSCLPTEYNYRLIVGFRRFTAVTQILKQTRIKGIIRAGLSNQEARILNLSENIDRKDLNILEEAQALAAIFPVGTTLAVASEGLKKSARWCAVRYHLLKMSPEIQSAAASGLITHSDVLLIASVAVNCQQDVYKSILARKAVKKGGWQTTRPRDPRPLAEDLKKRLDTLVYGGLGGFVGRLLLWAAGLGVSDAAIDAEIQHLLSQYEAKGDLSGHDLIGIAENDEEKKDANSIPQPRITRH